MHPAKRGQGSSLRFFAGIALAVLVLSVGSAKAEGVLSRIFDDIGSAASSGDWESYVSGYVWHMPFQYDSDARCQLNNRAWGGGLGRSYINRQGDKTSLFLMGFDDSHHCAQFNAGYMWTTYWSPVKGAFLGAGYSVFLFSRSDVANRAPIPAALPCFTARCSRLELIAFYCPHVSAEIPGNVVYFFARVRL
jgi:palmitoyl transferase